MDEEKNIDNDYSKFTVMVVDDEAPYRKYVARIISNNLNAHSLEATHPKEAFDLLNSNSVDLILLDLQMPVMDGVSALKEIRDMPKYQDIPVIACTALASKEIIRELASLKISDYILKPSEGRIITDKIRKVLDILKKQNKG